MIGEISARAVKVEPQELERLTKKARLLDELSEALARYAEARTTRSGEAQKLWLDLMAVMDRVDMTVPETELAMLADEDFETPRDQDQHSLERAYEKLNAEANRLVIGSDILIVGLSRAEVNALRGATLEKKQS